MLKPLNYLLVLFIILTSFISFAQDKPVKTISYQDIEPELSLKEAKNVKSIFDQYTVLDLDHPQFDELNQWLETLNLRLSEAVERTGKYYPHYKINVMVDPNPNAFIYKYRPTGQEFFRGHVFFSTGLLQNFLESFGGDFNKVTQEQLDFILNGLEGVIAHEYAHPKQDELVKWEWREANESTSAPHQQMDEMATDIMGTNLLEKAGLDRRGVYRGLDMLFADSMGGHFLQRSANAATSTHPENNLRLNVNRGNLSQKRISEGTPEVSKIDYQFEKMSKQLSELMELSDLKGILKLRIENELTFENVTEFLYGQAAKSLRLNLSPYIEILDELYIQEIANKTINEEIFVTFLDTFLNKNKMSSVYSSSSDGVVKKAVKKKSTLELYKLESVQNTLSKSHKAFSKFNGNEFSKLTTVYDQANIDKYFQRSLDLSRKQGHFTYSSTERNYRMFSYIRTFSSSVNQHLDALSNMVKYYSDSDLFPFKKNKYLTLNYWVSSPSGLRGEILTAIYRSSGKREWNSFFKRNHPLTPNEALEINKKYYELSRAILKAGKDNHSKLLPVILRHHYPESLGSNLRVNPGKAYPLFENDIFDIIKNNSWNKYNKTQVQRDLIKQLTKKNSAFSLVAQHQMLDKFIMQGITFKNLKTRLTHTDYIGKKMLRNSYIDKVVEEVALLRGKPMSDNVGWMGKKLKSRLNRDQMMAYFKRHLDKKNISRKQFITYTAHLTKLGQENNKLKDFNQTNTNNIWEALGSIEKTVEARLERILATAMFTDETVALDKFKKTGSPSQVSEYKGIKYDASYAAFIKKSRSQIINDFLKQRGLSRNDSELLLKNIEPIKNFARLIFNPDNKQLNRYQQDVHSFNSLDLIHHDFINLVPEGISFDDAYQIWDTMTAKRSNRFTDSFFIQHVYKRIDKSDTKLQKQILSSRKIRSQRILVGYLESIQSSEVKNIKGLDRDINKSELYKLLSEIERLVPESSNFRDDYLETLAWELNLSENLTTGFIEPLKSFNYKSLDMRSIKMLSLTSVLLEKMKIAERIALVKHIQNPTRDIVDVIPRITKYIKEIENKHVRDGVELFEGFIRESSEMQKLVLIEMIVGTKRYGLFFQDEAVKDQLYKLAGIEETENLKLFKTYTKTLPRYEHSIILSYLIATKSFDGLGEGSNLLKIAEAHGPVGIKGAQIADILSLFGDGHDLHLAKDQSLPATKAEIFKTLKEELSVSEYDQIKSVEVLAGSGGIKHVVIAQFHDGSREAIYLKRLHLEETINSTLNIVRNWEKLLSQDPDFQSNIDFKYYVDTLEKQLAQEIQFTNELKLSKIMANKYEAVPSYKSWSYKGVRPTKRLQNNNIMHFEAVEGAVSFSDLNDAQRKVVSEYIVQTEFDFLMKDGVFDADRHLGNYLFDPKNKVIYPIDFSQVYFLENNKVFTPGDKYNVANLIRGVSHSDPKKGSRIVAETLLRVSESTATSSKEELAKQIATVISDKSLAPNQVFTKVLAVLTENNVKLPVKYSLGVVKGLMIISNEDYAKTVDPAFLKKIVKKHVVKQMVKAIPTKIALSIKSACNRLFLGKK